MTELNDIEQAAAAYRQQRDLLAGAVAKMEDELQGVRSKHMEKIKPLIGQVQETYQELFDLVEGAPSLFTKPKTRIFAKIKVGFQKQPGKLVITDLEKTVKLIRKHLKGRVTGLLKVSVAPVKAAISKLTAPELKKIGCKIDAVDDAVVVTPVKSDAEAAIDALIEEQESKS